MADSGEDIEERVAEGNRIENGHKINGIMRKVIVIKKAWDSNLLIDTRFFRDENDLQLVLDCKIPDFSDARSRFPISTTSYMYHGAYLGCRINEMQFMISLILWGNVVVISNLPRAWFFQDPIKVARNQFNADIEVVRKRMLKLNVILPPLEIKQEKLPGDPHMTYTISVPPELHGFGIYSKGVPITKGEIKESIGLCILPICCGK
jgi:hypothetical protein